MSCIVEALADRPRISNQCCSALEKLAQATEPTNYDQQSSNALTPYFQHTLQALVINSRRDDFQGTGVDLA
jgi:hypothetical protein